MISERYRQVQMLARLRQVRLDSANRALAAARTAAEQAETERCAAEDAARSADTCLDGHRADLATNPCDPPTQLALVEQSLFLQAIARSASNDTQAALRRCEEEESAQRHATILARARHDVIRDQARTLALRQAAAREEDAAIEGEDRRKCI